MLTALYSFLLRRQRTLPPELASEMLTAFQEARQHARSEGLFPYLGFGVRELAGVARPIDSAQLRTQRPRRLRWVASFAVAGGLIAGVIAYSIPAQYTSMGVLRIASPSIPEHLIPSAGRTDLKRQFQNQVATVLSRHTLTEIMRTYGLYQSELTRMPLEDVVAEMRRDIAIRPGPEEMVQITFTYASPREAQKVARDLMTRLIDHSIRERSEELKSISRFLVDRSEAAAKAWMESTAALQRMKDNDPQYPRASLDVEMARQEYQSLRAKMGEARTFETAAAWKYDATLEVLDLPSLPRTERLNRPLIVAVGVFGGTILGLLLAWLRSIRPINPMISAPTSA